MSHSVVDDDLDPRRLGTLWLFDLDGCLVDSMGASILRPHARVLLEQLRQLGVAVHIWSAGGADYARRVAARVGIADLIVEYHTKDRGDDGRWLLPEPAAGADVVCVDDQPDGVPLQVRTISVFPFIGARPHDRTLAGVLARVNGDSG